MLLTLRKYYQQIKFFQKLFYPKGRGLIILHYCKKKIPKDARFNQSCALSNRLKRLTRVFLPACCERLGLRSRGAQLFVSALSQMKVRNRTKSPLERSGCEADGVCCFHKRALTHP